MLSVPGMEKINFSGGEPFLQDRGEYLGSLVKFCKQELQLPSVSIVSNGSLIRERWFQKYGEQSPLHVTLASITVTVLPSTLGLQPGLLGIRREIKASMLVLISLQAAC